MLKDVWCQTMTLDIQFNVVLSFKANFKIDEKFNAKGIQNNVA